MTFVTTWLAVAGAIGMSIPIVIHLLWRQRRRPIEWAAMRFLIEAFKRNKRRLQVEQLILLAVRCLIVLLLGGALARPLLDAAGLLDNDESRAVILIIDNGVTSATRSAAPIAGGAGGLASGGGGASTISGGGGGGNAGDALARHVAQAVSIIRSLGPSEAVGLITAARPVASPVIPPSVDHGAVITLLEGLTASQSASDLAGALRIARDTVADLQKDGRRAVVYLLSDFRAGAAPLDQPLGDLFAGLGDDVLLLTSPPADSPAPNVQITDLTPVRRLILPGAADGSQQITVHLARHGGDLPRGASRVRLSGDDISAAPRTVEWGAGQAEASVTFTINYDRALGREIGLTAIVDDDDALGLDNTRYVTLDVRDRLRVTLVSPPTFERIGSIERLTPGQWIRRALRTSDQSPIEVIDLPPGSVDDVELRATDAVIIAQPDRLTESGWGAVRRFVDRGGLTIIVPPADLNVHSWTEAFASHLDLPWRFPLEAATHPDGLLMADEQPASELLRLLQGELADLTRSLITYRSLSVDTTSSQAEAVLVFENGAPMLIIGSPRTEAAPLSESGAPLPPGSEGIAESGQSTRGLVLYLAVAPQFPEWTTLPIQMFMVPLFQEMVRQGLNMIRSTQRIEVGDRPVLPGLARAAESVIAPDGVTFSLDASRRPTRPLQKAGLYEVVDGAGLRVGRVAVNLDPRAARTDPQSAAAVAAWLGASGSWRVFDPAQPAALLAEAETGAALAGYLLTVVLALLVAETILARRFSHAYRGSGGVSTTSGLSPTLVGGGGGR